MKYKLGDLTVSHWNDWDRVPRDPITIAAAIAPSLFAGGAAIGFAGTALAFAVSLGISAVTSWAISALAPKPDFSSLGSQGVMVNARDATAPADFVYGEVRKGGTVTFYESTGEKNKFLHQIIVLAGHEVEAIEDIYINEEVVTWDEATGFVTSGEWGTTKTETVQDGVYEGGRVAGEPKYVTTEVPVFNIRIQKFLGDQTDNTQLKLLAESGLTGDDALDANFVGHGIAYLYVRYEYDREVFANGLPLVTAKVKGKKVYDPRTDTTAYSNNAALCMRDFITTNYGLNDNAIDDMSFDAAANESDEDVRLSTIVDAGNFVIGQQYEIKTVGTTNFVEIGASANAVGQVFVATGTGSGTGDAYRSERRYTINGIVKASSPIGKVLGDMSTACAGTLFWGSGYWKLKVGVYSAPVKSLTLDDLRGPINLSTRTSMRDSFNGVSGTFNNAADDYITADYPKLISHTDAGGFVEGSPYTILEVGNTDFTAIGASSNTVGVTFRATGAGSGTGKASLFLGEDGGEELLLDLPLPYTTSASAAQRIAKLTLFRGREQMTFSADFGLNAFFVEVGDIISFTNDRYGFNAKEFEVIGWAFASNQDAGDLRVTLTLQETSEAAFDWNAEETEIISNNTVLPDFNTVATVTNLRLFDGGFFGLDGTYFNSIAAYWEPSNDGFVDRYQVEWKTPAETQYQTTFTAEITALLESLEAEQEYEVRVRAINTIGVQSAWVYSSFTTLKDQVAPAAPTDVTSTQGIENVVVNWVNPTDIDLDQVEVIRSEVDDINDPSAASVAYVKGTYYVDVPPNTDQSYYYFVRAIDRTGNIGVPATVTTNSSRLIQSYDVDAGVIDLSKLSTDVVNTFASKVDIADYNFTVDGQQQIEDATTRLAEGALQLALNASSLESRINDAGITIDPATGSVVIQGIATVDGRLNETIIDLNAVEATINLKASVTYVNDQIAAATLPEASLAALGAFEARVDDVEIDVNAAKGAITLTSSGLLYNVNDGVLGVQALRTDIEIAQDQIVLKASATELDNINTRLGVAEVAISTIDAPSITLAVSDQRRISEKQDDLADLSLAEVVGRYNDRKYVIQDVAKARLSLTADVNEEKEARAASEFELSAQIDDNKALIREEQIARATEDSVLAESVTSLSASLFGTTGAITQINSVSLDSESNLARAVATLNTELRLSDGEFGVVETVSDVEETVGGIQSKYAVKVNTNGHVSGFGLISTANDGDPTSEFIIAADAFKIGAPTDGNTTESAFSVYTEDTVVDNKLYPAGTYVNGFLDAENINVGTLSANRVQLDTTAFETDDEGNLVIVSAGLPADKLKLGGEFKYNPETKELEVNTLNANTITSGTINTSRLNIDGATLAKDTLTGGLIVGTIDGTGNIAQGTIAADRVEANFISAFEIDATKITTGTITTSLLNLGDTSLASDGFGGLVVGTFDGDAHITGGSISAGRLRLGNTTLGQDISGRLVVGTIDGTGNIAEGTIAADRVETNFIDAFSISATNITTGTLNANRINLGDTTLTSVNGELVVGEVGVANIADASITTDKIGDLQVDTLKIKNGSVTKQGVAGSGLVTNNSATFTTIATFTLSNMPDTSDVQGLVAFFLSTDVSNYPNNAFLQVVVNGVTRADIPYSTLLVNQSRIFLSPFTLQSVPAGDIVVTLRMRNMGGYGVNNSNISAIAAMR